MRESVQWFSGEMEKQLSKHDEDCGESWKKHGVLSLFEHLEREVIELRLALQDAIQSFDVEDEKVIEDCADVANLAMMVADVTRHRPRR